MYHFPFAVLVTFSHSIFTSYAEQLPGKLASRCSSIETFASVSIVCSAYGIWFRTQYPYQYQYQYQYLYKCPIAEAQSQAQLHVRQHWRRVFCRFSLLDCTWLVWTIFAPTPYLPPLPQGVAREGGALVVLALFCICVQRFVCSLCLIPTRCCCWLL